MVMCLSIERKRVLDDVADQMVWRLEVGVKLTGQAPGSYSRKVDLPGKPVPIV
jgi:hypothetical protein